MEKRVYEVLTKAQFIKEIEQENSNYIRYKLMFLKHDMRFEIDRCRISIKGNLDTDKKYLKMYVGKTGGMEFKCIDEFQKLANGEYCLKLCSNNGEVHIKKAPYEIRI